MTFGDLYAGVEAEAEIAPSGWAIERAPSGRSYDMRRPWAAGLAACLGWVLNDSALVYARAGVTTARAEVDYATSGTTASRDETLTGWTLGAGLEAAVTEKMRLRIEYVRSEYDAFTLEYGAGRTERFDTGESQVRVGLSWAF